MLIRGCLAGLIAGLMLAGAAQAGAIAVADTPPVFTWTGFYGGENSAYTWTDGPATPAPDGLWATASDAANNVVNVASGGGQSASFIGGGDIGFNYQIMDFVVGVETDLTYTNLNAASAMHINVGGSSCCAGTLTFTPNVSSHWLSTMRGRFGTTVDNMLIYATGGLAIAGRTFNNGYAVFTPSGQDFSIGTASRTAAGLAIGGGLEYALTKNWTFKGEYLYADLGPGHSLLPDDAGAPGNFGARQMDLSQSVVRAGLNYKFDWFGNSGPAFDK